MIKVEGKVGISATIIADSVSSVTGDRLTTMELVYPRIIHAEFLTHRLFSRNAASSRAIPFKKMSENLNSRPVRFGAANPGMQDTGTDYEGFLDADGRISEYAADVWTQAKESAFYWSSKFNDAKFHKQIYNRLTEPFQYIKVVVSATEWNNFYWLRNDVAADPSLQELARCMQEAREQSRPMTLHPGEWHLPYVECYRVRDSEGNVKLRYHIELETVNFPWPERIEEYPNGFPATRIQVLSTEEAIKVSAARSAAVSFRNVDYGLEKSIEVYDRLVGDERKHGSAMEHAGSPMQATRQGSNTDTNFPTSPLSWERGVSHVDKDYNLWSGNFKGFVQHRKTISGENKEG